MAGNPAKIGKRIVCLPQLRDCYARKSPFKAVDNREVFNITTHEERLVGWREWVAIPALNLPAIKAKVDTGARTSALHAFYLEPFSVNGVERIRFGVHPVQRRKDIVVECEADILDRRAVTDSGGHRETRYTIEVEILLGGEQWPIEMTLTDRDTMQFRMLLGRTALRGRTLVDPTRSYRTGRRKRADIVRIYTN